MLSYNFNIQQECSGTVLQVAYVGSQGRHLRLFGDYNQGIGGRRPISQFTSLNASGQPVSAAGGSMTIQESVSNSNYNGLWLSAEKRLAKGLTFNTSYTFSKSIDNNSVGSSQPADPELLQHRGRARALGFRRAPALRAQRHLPAALANGTRNGFTTRLSQGWSIAPSSICRPAIRSARSYPTTNPEQPVDLRPSQPGARAAAHACPIPRRRNG